MTTKTTEARREAFESAFARVTPQPVFFRNGEGYLDPITDASWWGYNAALDSLCVTLPEISMSMFATQRDYNAVKEGMDICRNALTAAGVPYK